MCGPEAEGKVCMCTPGREMESEGKSEENESYTLKMIRYAIMALIAEISIEPHRGVTFKSHLVKRPF